MARMKPACLIVAASLAFGAPSNANQKTEDVLYRALKIEIIECALKRGLTTYGEVERAGGKTAYYDATMDFRKQRELARFASELAAREKLDPGSSYEFLVRLRGKGCR